MIYVGSVVMSHVVIFAEVIVIAIKDSSAVDAPNVFAFLRKVRKAIVFKCLRL